MNCEHLNFKAKVEVNRLTRGDSGPVTDYMADVRIECAACGLPFLFKGVQVGMSPHEPKVSFDRTDIRFPLAPSDGCARLPSMMPGYSVGGL